MKTNYSERYQSRLNILGVNADETRGHLPRLFVRFSKQVKLEYSKQCCQFWTNVISS